MNVNIELAVEEDLNEMALVNVQAYSRDPMLRMVFKFDCEKYAPDILEVFRAKTAEQVADAKAHVFKATLPGTNKIIGFVGLPLEDGENIGWGFKDFDPPADANVERPIPPFMYPKNAPASFRPMDELKAVMKGRKHYYISGFAVRPEYQGSGVGFKLLQKALEIADAAGIETQLVAFPGSHSQYLKHGFEDVDHRDSDLNAWDGYRMRGFGIYRQYAMVRKPRKGV